MKKNKAKTQIVICFSNELVKLCHKIDKINLIEFTQQIVECLQDWKLIEKERGY